MRGSRAESAAAALRRDSELPEHLGRLLVRPEIVPSAPAQTIAPRAANAARRRHRECEVGAVAVNRQPPRFKISFAKVGTRTRRREGHEDRSRPTSAVRSVAPRARAEGVDKRRSERDSMSIEALRRPAAMSGRADGPTHPVDASSQPVGPRSETAPVPVADDVSAAGSRAVAQQRTRDPLPGQSSPRDDQREVGMVHHDAPARTPHAGLGEMRPADLPGRKHGPRAFGCVGPLRAWTGRSPTSTIRR